MSFEFFNHSPSIPKAIIRCKEKVKNRLSSYSHISPRLSTCGVLEYTKVMKLLGIDYGSKRVGIALSDIEGQFAMPFTTIKVSKDLVKEVLEIAEKNGVKEIVIGESKDYSGSENPIMVATDAFKKTLETESAKLGRDITVHFELEFMTSHQAARTEHTLGNRAKVDEGGKGKSGGTAEALDASAAAIILQSFLDKRQSAR